LTGQQRDNSRMKTNSKNRAEFPKRLKLASAEVTIYRHTNRTRRLNSHTG
jgi:hypothetical protein